MRAGRVLVIDDDLAIGRIMLRLLSGEFEVILVTSGVEGLARIRENPDFDAILTDLEMPDLDGAALFAAICATSPSLADRVLFVSGSELPASLLERGMEHRLVPKPFSRDKLLDGVRRVARSPKNGACDSIKS